MAYNNGIVVVADEVKMTNTSEGGPGLAWMTGATELLSAQNWSDLSERYASFVEKSVAAI
jgi:hypothetical protein